MVENNWMPLIEYSTKHNVSISTLRRRIKEKTIPFKLVDGRYFIVDEEIEKASKGRKPIQITATSGLEVSAEPKREGSSQLIDELKKAFSATLHGKEEMIFQLKEEISDLKTLVRVLEEEVERLKSTNANQY